MNAEFIGLYQKAIKFSPLFYGIMLVLLIIIQADLFKDGVVNDWAINAIIILVAIPLGSFFVDKIINRNKQTPKPFTFCPDCNGRMEVLGGWQCTKCRGKFKKPKSSS